MGERAVGVIDRRAGVSFIGQVTPDTAAFADVDGVVVVHVREFHVVLDLQPIENLDRALRTEVHRLIIVRIVLEQTIVAVETTGNVVVQLAIITTDRDIMVLGEGILLVQFAIPVRIAIIRIFAVGIDFPFLRNALFLAAAEFFQPSQGEFLRLIDVLRVGRVVVPSMICLVEVAGIFITIGNEVGHRRRTLQREVT